MSYRLKVIGRRINSLFRVPAVIVFATAAVALLTAVPRGGLAVDAVIGDGRTPQVQISDEEQLIHSEMANLLLQEAYDLSNVDMDLVDYDILLNIPVQLENIHDNVDMFEIKCFIGSKDVNDPRAWPDWTISYEIVRDLPGTQYSGTIRFPLTIPPEDEEVYVSPDVPDDVEPDDVNWYQCFLHLHNLETDSWGYTTPYSPELEYSEPWQHSLTTFDDLKTEGYIEW